MLARFLADARQSAAGKRWEPRALLLVICAWIFVQHLRDPLYGGIVKGLNLVIHEMGHALFGYFGDTLGIAGGTILQLMVPLIAAWLFYRQGDFFGIAVAACWLGTNFFDVAAYAGDARAGVLALVSIGGGEPEHDWFIMLAERDLLNYDQQIAGAFKAAGVICFAAGLAFGGWLVNQMRMTRGAEL